MKLRSKKGFTIVELVIVIAVIAILAAVLIPTFSTVIKNAKKSAALQSCKAAYIEAYANVLEDGIIGSGESGTSGGWTFTFNEDGSAIGEYSGEDAKINAFTGYKVDANGTVTFD